MTLSVEEQFLPLSAHLSLLAARESWFLLVWWIRKDSR